MKININKIVSYCFIFVLGMNISLLLLWGRFRQEIMWRELMIYEADWFLDFFIANMTLLVIVVCFYLIGYLIIKMKRDKRLYRKKQKKNKEKEKLK